MEKQEIKITENMWPVIVKDLGEGNVEVTCPFFSDCKVKGSTEIEALQKIETKIAKSIERTKRSN